MAGESGGRGGSEAPRRKHDPRDKRIEELEREIAKLNEDLARTSRDRDRWKRRSENLKKQLDEARRAGKRQAAPFAKDRPQGSGKPPGRRPGALYGRQGSRRCPPKVDEVHRAPVPTACPDCGGAVEVTRVASQYQEELPRVRPIVRRFDIEVGRCSRCRGRVQGRHPLQTSDALGAAAVQLGPGLASLVVELHTEMGMPLAKVAGLLRTRLGVQVTTGGLVRLPHRTARDATPVYRELCRQVRLACSCHRGHRIRSSECVHESGSSPLGISRPTRRPSLRRSPGSTRAGWGLEPVLRPRGRRRGGVSEVEV